MRHTFGDMFALAAAVALGLHHAMTRINRPWESEVFYHIFPRSYRDSNGDRVGDFKGIQDGLDSIQKLGCTTILLNPIYKARVYHNYFADDWFDVDPKFGTLADFRALCDAAHAKGMRVIIDMEPQYAADRHVWYKAALANPKGKEAGYFQGDLANGLVKGSPWYNGAPVHIASVNLNNPFVRSEITRNFHFWCEQGVDGFRIDHMMDDLDWQGKSANLYAGLWSPLEVAIKKDFPGTFFIGEQADWDSYRSVVDMFGKTPTDAAFNFRLQNALLMLRRTALEGKINEYNNFTKAGREQANFLENHDMPRYASAEPDPVKQRCAAALLMAVKGIPSIYFGQELGMKGIQGHWNTDGNDIPVRLAYRWGATVDAPGTATWYHDTGPWWSPRFSSDHDGISYEEQDGDPASLLNWYRKLIHLRTSSVALSVGAQKIFDTGADQVLGFERTRDGAPTVRVLANLSAVSVKVGALGSGNGSDLISGQNVDLAVGMDLSPWQVAYVEMP